MSTSGQTNSFNQPNDSKLSLLYAEQHSLLERLSIHQRNLHELLRQKALHGIAVPLSIINGVAHEEASINDVEKDLAIVNQQIDEIISKHAKPLEQLDKPLTFLNIDNVDYLIVAPYPTLGNHTTISPSGEMFSTFRFVGGFEMHSTIQSNGPMTVSFFRHGRQVVPQIDQANRKIIIPVGRAITVNQVTLSIRTVEIIQDIPPNR